LVRRVDKEHSGCRNWFPFLPLAIPVPLAKGNPGEGYPWQWSVYRWLEGENATIEHIVDLRQAATDLAHFIVALQEIEPTGGPPARRGVPLAGRNQPTREAIAALRGTLDADAVTAAWDAALAASAWQGPPVWVHGDLLPGTC
jgi:aminoglycoside phosphotransferase (APT) family kinase protein